MNRPNIDQSFKPYIFLKFCFECAEIFETYHESAVSQTVLIQFKIWFDYNFLLFWVYILGRGLNQHCLIL
jgi:hypothetical protein